jgi:hypothetical protein
MASLIKIDEEIVTSAVASVTLTGIDSTYDVYMVKLNNVAPDTDSRYLQIRFTESGTPNITPNYDQAVKALKTTTTFGNGAYPNQTFAYAGVSFLGTGTSENINGIYYIFNANNSSEYTFATIESNYVNSLQQNFGDAGGFVFTQTSTVDGIHFFLSSTGNIDTGAKFTLYGLKK